MPWSPPQRRAIAASYKRRGKPIPAHVRDELRGKSQPKRRGRKKRRRSAREDLAHKMLHARRKGKR